MSNKDFAFKAQKRLQKLCAFGTSKYQIKNKAKALAKENGSNNWPPVYNNLIRGKIFSYSTFKTYTKNATRFFKWVAQTHPEIKNINGCKRCIQEYLNRNCPSAWTAATTLAALGKVYGQPSTELAKVPKRRRADITRSRTEPKNPAFSETKNKELVHFCLNTGLRRSELEKLCGRDLEFDGTEYHLRIKGKGGKVRLVPVCDKAVINRMKNTEPEQRVWGKIPSHAPIHRYRAQYAANLYRELAREVQKIPKKERYICRGDLAGRVFDKKAMATVSKNLGHTRLSVISSHYLYDFN